MFRKYFILTTTAAHNAELYNYTVNYSLCILYDFKWLCTIELLYPETMNNDGLLLIKNLWANIDEILIKTRIFSFEKMYFTSIVRKMAAILPWRQYADYHV